MRLAEAQFDALFTAFERSSDHLETRDAYGTAVELPHMAKWLLERPAQVAEPILQVLGIPERKRPQLCRQSPDLDVPSCEDFTDRGWDWVVVKRLTVPAENRAPVTHGRVEQLTKHRVVRKATADLQQCACKPVEDMAMLRERPGAQRRLQDSELGPWICQPTRQSTVR